MGVPGVINQSEVYYRKPKLYKPAFLIHSKRWCFRRLVVYSPGNFRRRWNPISVEPAYVNTEIWRKQEGTGEGDRVNIPKQTQTHRLSDSFSTV